MYIDQQTQSYLGSMGNPFARFKARASAPKAQDPIERFKQFSKMGRGVPQGPSLQSRIAGMGKRKAPTGYRMGSGFRHDKRQCSKAPTMAGDGFLFNSDRMYLQGEEMGGWLTDMTRPVSRVVRDVGSSAMSVVRVGTRAAAPALVSALTGKPVQMSDAASGTVQMQAMPQTSSNNTLMIAGVGLAAVLLLGGTFALARRK